MSTLRNKLWCVILSLALLINLLPVSALASEAPLEQAVVQHWVEDPPVEATEKTTQPLEIVSEDTSKRGEYYKEFVLTNGLRMASLYAEPVHYSEDGQWKEIDNTLKLSAGTYTNTAGKWQVSFPQQLTKDKAVTITKDGYTLSFYMAGELYQDTTSLIKASLGTAIQDQPVQLQSFQAATAQLQAVQRPELKEETVYPQVPAEKSHARLEYANVSNGTDIVYDLSGNQVKESIVMDAYSARLRGYRYTLNVGELNPVLTDSGEINLYDCDNKEIVMVMPAPFLVDAAGEYCYDIELTLTGSGSRYTLTYLLPQQWLADTERQWPVVLDPMVNASIANNNIKDVSVYERNCPHTHKEGILDVGHNTEYGKMRTFLKYDNLPPLSSSDVVIYAMLRLYKPNDHSTTNPVEIHKVTSTWTSSNTTWANQPGHDPMVIDYDMVKDHSYYYWETTDVVRGWYEGTNTGLMLKAPDWVENTTSTSSYRKQFYSSDYYATSTAHSPALTIVFRNNNGLEGYWDYTSSSAGRAGTGSINDFTGNLVWIHSDLGFGGNRMPVSISHIYNANDSANNDFGLGYGWRTNYNQRAYKSTLANLDKEYYVWEDADGTDHYFYYDSKVGKYVDEDGLELTMTLSNGLPEKITNKDGNTYHFDAKGRLKKLENNQSTPSKITIDYVNDTKRISKITDGANRKYHFSYSGNLLTEISYVGSAATSSDGALPPAIAYSYSNGCLTEITYEDGESSCFTYTTPPANSTDPKHLLLTAQDIDGYKLTYTYITQGAGKPSRVKTVTETHNGETGSTLTLTYAHNQTTFTDNLGNVQIKQFNNWGNTTAVQDDEGRAQFANYTSNDPSESGKGNQLILSSKLQNTVGNLLNNSSFEGTAVWSAVRGTAALCTTTAYMGTQSIQFSKKAAETTGYVMTPAYTAEPGKTYTFSAYVKTGAGASAYLSIGTTRYNRSEVIPANQGWTRLEVSYTNNGTSNETMYAKVLSDTTGPIYVDCVQLEEAETASRYNIIQNGDFRFGSNGWIMSQYCDSDEVPITLPADKAAPASELDQSAFQIVGDPSNKLRIRQEVPVSGKKGDTFVLAGWAMGDGIPLTCTEEEKQSNKIRQFTLRGSFIYSTDTEEQSVFEFKFNPDTGGTDIWQYAAGVMVAKEDFDSIKIQVLYDFGANTIYFDGIQLYKEEFGNSYAYDAKGNVTSVKDLQGQETKYEYTNNNLTEMTLPTGAKLTYEYDDYHNVIKATTEKGVVYEFEYDEDGYGNNTKVSITDASGTITSTATYSTDGNRLESTTDTLGQITTYGYHPDTNVLEWVKYPKDTDVTKTVYTYDDMYRTAQAAVTTDTGLNLSAEYTYDNDLLMSIETARTIYDFTYGNFARRESVDIGERNLATYRYKPGTNWLETLDYGNEDFVQYTYDDQGRVIRQDYDSGAYVTYKYDNSGALAKVYDSQTGTTSTYYYDFTDRMMKYVETSGSGTHSVGYTYDNINNLTKLVETIGTEKRETSYTYDEDNRPITVNTAGSYRSYIYDTFGRVSKDETRHHGTILFSRNYAYQTPSGGGNSNVLYGLSYDGASFDRSFMANRDANGNIVYTLDGTNISTYQYDSANQLIRENNIAAGTTTIWTYDNAGNILTREVYPRCSGTPDPATRISLVNYTYDDDKGWGDLLTEYNGVPITHDEIGNPLNDGTWTYTWQHGRQLASMAKIDQSESWQFTYNADGMRTQRTKTVIDPDTGNTVTDLTYNYTYLGSQLTHMSVGEHTMYFAYDAAGVPLSLTYDSENYYYVTTIQGDVVSILNASGIEVVRYIYDAWGNPISTTGTLATTIGFYNPLRYRGYVYDPETELYYLQSRYYNPEMGRFINGDNYPSTGQGLIGNNMFAYCGNNPVFREDDGGEVWNIVIGAAIGGITSFVSGVVAEALDPEGDFSWKSWVRIGCSTILGTVEGALIAACPAAAMGISAGMSVADTVVCGLIDNDSAGEIIVNSVVAGGFGAVTGAGGGDFVYGDELLNTAASIGKKIPKGVHPIIKKTATKATQKAYKKAIKQVTKSYLASQFESFAYGGMEKFTSVYANAAIKMYR